MNAVRKCVAGGAAFGMLAGIALPANANLAIRQFGATRQLGASAPQLLGRVQVAGAPRSIFRARDFGRRQPNAPVTASIMLRYNRQAELDALVAAQSNRRSPLYRHFLTNAQFNNYFAPTPQQQAYVIANLQAAGLRITHTFPNRTLVDVVGTSAAAERFFDTEIHSLSQDRYGARFANVKPVTVPANLAPLIRTVSLSNLIIAKTGPHRASAARAALMRASLAGGRRAPAFTGFTSRPTRRRTLRPTQATSSKIRASNRRNLATVGITATARMPIRRPLSRIKRRTPESIRVLPDRSRRANPSSTVTPGSVNSLRSRRTQR